MVTNVRDGKLARLGFELLDPPVLTKSKDVQEGDAFAISTSAFATAYILVERAKDETIVASVDLNGTYRADADWASLSRSEVYVLGSLS